MGLAQPAEKVITVAGTNGKGSTVAFIEAIARAAGWQVGAYTSPHLLRYNERVRIDGHDVDDAALVAAFEAVEAARGDTPLTYFEYGTLAALWLFERSRLDLAILEVGLGGRLDAVNIVDADVAVITTVDLDHQDWLGDDREAIGAEKAGIARAWKPLVLGDDDPPSSVLGHAYRDRRLRDPRQLRFLLRAASTTKARGAGARSATTSNCRCRALAAPVQLRNAADRDRRAARAGHAAAARSAIAQGVAEAHVPGRLQRFERDGVEIVVDVGHNPQAARELARMAAAAPVAGPHAGGVRRAGRQGRRAAWSRRWRRASTAGSWPGWRTAGPRGVAVDVFAERLRGTAAADGAAPCDGRRRRWPRRAGAGRGRAIACWCSDRSTPWPRR